VAKQSVFTHDIIPRIRAGHSVLSIVTHEWERVQNDLIVASERLDRRLLAWSSANNAIQELLEEDGDLRWDNLKINGEEIPIQFDDIWNGSVPSEGPDWVSGRVGRCTPDFLLSWYKQHPELHNSILWLRDITPYMDSTTHGATTHERRALVRRIRDFCIGGEEVLGKTVVMTFPENYLPVELEKDVEQFSLPLPDDEIMLGILKMEIDTWNDLHPEEQVKMPRG
ncbi:uncharacterized protein METZ01_LOCUS445012, partial [marine metagenome]